MGTHRTLPVSGLRLRNGRSSLYQLGLSAATQTRSNNCIHSPGASVCRVMWFSTADTNLKPELVSMKVLRPAARRPASRETTSGPSSMYSSGEAEMVLCRMPDSWR